MKLNIKAADLQWNVKTFFRQRLLDQRTLNAIPQAEPTGNVDDWKVYLHLFIGGWDWYITNISDPVNGIAFGFVKSPFGGEWGDIWLPELATVRAQGVFPVERDLYWTTCRFGDIKRIREEV